MVPFVERNYNLVELGPRGTGKSHLFQQISPYAHLISGGKATVAKMFVNNANGQRGLVCQYDVVCFDEVSGISFDQKDGVNIMKGYMASGEFSRGKESIRAEGGIVMVGNFDVDVEQQQRIGHLLSPLPPEMRDDTAFMDRIHAYAPGWDFPKLNPNEHLTDHFGLVSDFLSECWSRLRDGNRVSALQGRVHLGGALSGRDIEAVNKTVSGLTEAAVPRSRNAGLRRRPGVDRPAGAGVPPAREGAAEAVSSRASSATPTSATRWASTASSSSSRRRSCTAMRRSRAIRCRRDRSGASVSGTAETGPGLYRIEVTCGPGSGVQDPEPADAAGLPRERQGRRAEPLHAGEGTGRRPRPARSTSSRSRCGRWMRTRPARASALPVLVALCGGLLGRNTRGGTIIVGALNLGGSIEMIPNAVAIAELAIDKQAQTLLMPVSARRQLNDLPDELWTKISIEFYKDAADAVFKALVE